MDLFHFIWYYHYYSLQHEHCVYTIDVKNTKTIPWTTVTIRSSCKALENFHRYITLSFLNTCIICTSSNTIAMYKYHDNIKMMENIKTTANVRKNGIFRAVERILWKRAPAKKAFENYTERICSLILYEPLLSYSSRRHYYYYPARMWTYTIHVI